MAPPRTALSCNSASANGLAQQKPGELTFFAGEHPFHGFERRSLPYVGPGRCYFGSNIALSDFLRVTLALARKNRQLTRFRLRAQSCADRFGPWVPSNVSTAFQPPPSTCPCSAQCFSTFARVLQMLCSKSRAVRSKPRNFSATLDITPTTANGASPS